MSDTKTFEQIKQAAIQANEAQYGQEIRDKYGDQRVEASNKKVANMSQAQWDQAQQLSADILSQLGAAMVQGDPASPQAQAMCDLHRQWVTLFWPAGTYSKQAHLALADGYLADERFRAYYDVVGPGATQFLREALGHYCAE
ncbi:TPA: TipAS antibiotic-recognition domain-containing protein [Streptococcus suis]